jgi:hypothetical protein
LYLNSLNTGFVFKFKHRLHVMANQEWHLPILPTLYLAKVAIEVRSAKNLSEKTFCHAPVPASFKSICCIFSVQDNKNNFKISFHINQENFSKQKKKIQIQTWWCSLDQKFCTKSGRTNKFSCLSTDQQPKNVLPTSVEHRISYYFQIF